MARSSLVPPIINGNIFSLVQEVVFLGQRCQFSMYYARQDTSQKTSVQDGHNGLFTQWSAVILPLLRPCLSVGTLIGSVRIWCLTWPEVATGIYATGTLHGTDPGEPLPPQIAGVLTKQTALRGRSGRGRMYLCGMSEDSSTNGAPAVALLTKMNTLAQKLRESWLDVATGINFSPAVISLKQYAIDSLNPPVPPALVGTPKPGPVLAKGGAITNMVADEIWYTQRRRTLGRGQ